MSFVHNEPSWTNHEQHRRYHCISYVNSGPKRYPEEDSYHEQSEFISVREDASLQLKPYGEECNGVTTEAPVFMMDLMRHHRLARELLLNRAEFDVYDAELSELLFGLRKDTVTPSDLLQEPKIQEK